MTTIQRKRLYVTAGILATAAALLAFLQLHAVRANNPRHYAEAGPNPGHDHRTYVPKRVSGEDRVEADVTSARGLEITVTGDDGDALVFFEPDSFAEQAEITVVAEVQPVSTFFGTAKAGLNLPDDAIELSATLSVKALSGNSGSLQRVRLSLPFNDAVPEDELENYEIIAVFSYPLRDGGVTTQSLDKKVINYSSKGLVTYWTQGIPLEAVIIGVPK